MQTSALETFQYLYHTDFRDRIILQRIVLKHDRTSQLVQLEGFHSFSFAIMIYAQVTMKTMTKHLLHYFAVLAQYSFSSRNADIVV